MPQFFALTIVLAGGVVIAVWLWSDDNRASKEPGGRSPLALEEHTPLQTEPPSNREDNQNRINDPAALRNSDAKPHESGEIVDLATSFLNAPSAVDAEDAVFEAESSGLTEAADWRMQLDVACNPDELEYTSNRATTSQQHYAQKLSSYCDGYVPKKDLARPMNLNEIDQQFLDLARTQFKDQLSRNLSDINNSETDDFLVRRLKAANTPEEIHAAGDYLVEYYRSTGHVLWRPNAGDLEVSDVVITNLQQVALELYSCQRFGGCGPNSLKVVRICAFVAGCEPGWSYEQYLFMNHSPIEMEYIQRVIQHIYSG